jgi:hypothetical protein
LCDELNDLITPTEKPENIELEKPNSV